MRRYIKQLSRVIFPLLFMSINSCKNPQKKIIVRFKDGSPGIIYDYPDMRDTSTYTYLQFFHNGRVYQKMDVKKNKIVGTPTVYYKGGKVYKVDSLYQPQDRYSPIWNGIQRKYYENGVIAAEFNVKDGIIEGKTRVYNIKGNLIKQYYLIKDSIKDGDYKEFYSSGKISVIATFKNNALHGMMYYFSEKGDTDKYYNCNQGGIVMPYKKWLPNGTILVGNYFDKGGKDIVWKWYTKDGKEVKKEIHHPKNGISVVPE